MKFSVNGRIYHKNCEEQDTIVEIEAENKAEAKFFFSHGVFVEQFPDSTVTVDLRTVKEVAV